MNLKKHVLGILLAIAVPVCATAQNVTVKGQVKDDAGEPLALVSIAEPGTSNGTVTDLDGNYSISVASNGTLQFSFMGYTTVTEQVNGRTTINVTLSEDAELLEEIVVIGYGVQKKSDLTGAVTSVRTDDLKNRSTPDAAAALQGKASGIQVINQSGAPGKGADIRVRGYSSNSGNIGPLYIVDGLQVSSIQYLDPEMIESIEVLKDAASAAIYGAQAGNGVVLVTTKTGGKGQGKIFYNGQFSYSTLSRKLNTMRAADYIAFGKANGYLSDALLNTYYDKTTDVNWGEEIFVPTWSNRQTVGFQGGNDKGNYFVSINNVDNNGIFRGDKDEYKRLTMQINADYKIKDWLTVGTNTSIEKWGTKGVSEQNDNGSALLSAITSSPLFPVRGDASKLSAAQATALSEGKKLLVDPETGLYWTVPLIGETQSGHPYVQRDATDSSNDGITLRGVAYLNLTPIKGLTYTSRFGYQVNQQTQHSYTEPYFSSPTIQATNYTLSADVNSGYNYQWENFVNFNRTFGNSEITAMAGMSFKESFWDNMHGEATGPDILKGYEPNYIFLSNVLSNESTTRSYRNEPGRSASLSYFGRIGYSYANKYAAQVNFRADAFDTSKLPADARWGYFPSVSAGWTISNESFIKDNIDREVLSFLKFRASWGVNGNVNVLNNYKYSTSIIKNTVFYQYNVDSPTMSLGSLPSGLANPDLRWERSVQTDLGIDARFLDNRLSLSLDFYNKNTDDLLVQVSPSIEVGVPAFTDKGISANSTINAGSINNKGLEIELGWRDQIGDFSYEVNANTSFLKNKVTYLEPTVGRLTGRTVQGTYLTSVCEEGYPIWYMLGFKATGIDNEGYALFATYDADGNQTGETRTPDQTTDRVMIGKGIPDMTYGLTVNMAWKNFDLSIFGTGVAGVEIYPTAFRVDRPSCNTYSYYWENSWKQAGDEATAKFPAANHWNSESFSSTLSVFDGSYFKIKQIQLGYTIPKSITKKFAVSNLRAYGMLDNYITFSKYIGLDPETAGGGTNALGFDMGNYPTSKSIIFGLNVEF